MANLAKENILCVYRNADSDSYSYALRYKNMHGLDAEQIVGINCSNLQILSDYVTFQLQVENPILNILNSAPINTRNIFAIVLMPFVPNGFYDGSDIISSTSRISAINQSYSKNSQNALYDRQIFKRFDEFDANSFYICTQIDAPITVLPTWFSNMEAAKNRLVASGNLYIDAYSNYTYAGVDDYTSDLEQFSNNYATRLGLNIKRTTQLSKNRDPFFANATDDSFFWSWGIDKASTTFFKSSSYLRGFFYNADTDGALSIRSASSRNWPLLAIRAGYVATAGALKATSANQYLRPQPFMDTLFRGATLGEAFMFSQPYLNSTICCFGDPLQYFQFATTYVETTLISREKAWQNMEDYFARAAATMYRKCQIIERLRNKIGQGTDEQVQIDLLYPFNTLYDKYTTDSWKTDFYLIYNDFINFATGINNRKNEIYYTDLNKYLDYTGNKISDIVLQTAKDQEVFNYIDSANIIPIGYWEFSAELEHYYGEFRFYNIELEVAKNFEDFIEGNILLTKKSFDDKTNWYFEDIDGEYKPFTNNGLTSNFEGRKFKYISSTSEYLQRGEFYWFRVRQIDQLTEFDWRYYVILIYH